MIRRKSHYFVNVVNSWIDTPVKNMEEAYDRLNQYQKMCQNTNSFPTGFRTEWLGLGFIKEGTVTYEEVWDAIKGYNK